MAFVDMAERLLALRTPGEIAIAPDGETIAFSVHPAAARTGSHLPERDLARPSWWRGRAPDRRVACRCGRPMGSGWPSSRIARCPASRSRSSMAVGGAPERAATPRRLGRVDRLVRRRRAPAGRGRGPWPLRARFLGSRGHVGDTAGRPARSCVRAVRGAASSWSDRRAATYARSDHPECRSGRSTGTGRGPSWRSCRTIRGGSGWYRSRLVALDLEQRTSRDPVPSRRGSSRGSLFRLTAATRRSSRAIRATRASSAARSRSSTWRPARPTTRGRVWRPSGWPHGPTPSRSGTRGPTASARRLASSGSTVDARSPGAAMRSSAATSSSRSARSPRRPASSTRPTRRTVSRRRSPGSTRRPAIGRV